MKMRPLGKTGIMVSEIGLGCEHLQGMKYEQIRDVLDAAEECGINAMDTFMSQMEVRRDIGRALKGRRERFVIQGHIGSVWANGQYRRSRDLAESKQFFEDYLKQYNTDYIDIGMLHFVDDDDDWDALADSPIMEYAYDLKRKGVIRAIGMSSHAPLTALKAARSGLIDVMMFSINPAYDMLSEDRTVDELFDPATYNGGLTLNPQRALLYAECERLGIGITVMKALGAGSLLKDESSPFGKAFTVAQLMHYALSRPAVASVMAGATTPEQVRAAAAYETTSDAERDYASVLMNAPKFSLTGRCMYCNHCLPCPKHIDVAQVNKYLDLAFAHKDNVPESVREHYLTLDHTAGECVECGACEKRCPFAVPVRSRMNQAKKLFGR